MKCLVSKGFKYLVALFIILSCVSVRAMAKETNDTADQSNRITEKGNTSKDETFDTTDELMSNDPKKSISSQDSASDKGKNEASSTKDSVRTEYTFEDSKIKVKAVLEKADAVSDQAELKVKEIPENTTEYKKYEKALTRDSNLSSNLLLYDISFILNGKEVEPTDGQVKISMSFKDQQLSDDLKLKSANDLKVIHFKDNDVNKQESLQPTTNVKNETASFETKSFSTYAVVTENGQTKNAYSISNYSVPDLGYGVTANEYHQTGHTETNVFVKEFNSENSSAVGTSGRYSNAGGNNYIGSFGTVHQNQLVFTQQPMKLELGTDAKQKYGNGTIHIMNSGQNESAFDKSCIQLNSNESAVKDQIDLMEAPCKEAVDQLKNANIDEISSGPVTIDLFDRPAGTYIVKFTGNDFNWDSKIKIKSDQKLIFWCTTNSNLSIRRYQITTKFDGVEETIGTGELIDKNEVKYDNLRVTKKIRGFE